MKINTNDLYAWHSGLVFERHIQKFAPYDTEDTFFPTPRLAVPSLNSQNKRGKRRAKKTSTRYSFEISSMQFIYVTYECILYTWATCRSFIRLIRMNSSHAYKQEMLLLCMADRHTEEEKNKQQRRNSCNDAKIIMKKRSSCRYIHKFVGLRQIQQALDANNRKIEQANMPCDCKPECSNNENR